MITPTFVHQLGVLGQRRRDKSGSRARSLRGFTLLEITITVSIMLVLAAIALPQVNAAVANYRMRGTVSSVTGAIQSTRYLAISRGYPCKLAFNKAASTYQVSGDSDINGSFETQIGGVVPLASSLPTLNQDTTFTFRPGGKVESDKADANTGITTLTLSYAGRTGKIEVSTYGNISVTYTP